MKILFVISSLGNGGAERVLSILANKFSEKNEVYILTFDNKKPFYLINDNINLIQLDILKRSRSYLDAIKNNIRRITVLRKNIYEIQPNVVISYLTQTNIISTLSNIYNRKPLIITEHSIYKSENNNIFWKLLRIMTYPFANNLVLLTKEDSDNYFFIKNKTVIPNPIELPKEDIDLNNKENIILAVGRLHPVKQFDKLIEMYSKMDTDYKLYIIGDGNEIEKLKFLINKLSLNNKVFLKGRVSNINDFYKKAKIFVLTSKYESFSNVIIEAMSFGCAVISFDCDYGPRTIITNNKDGFLVKNEQEFLKKINLLINNEQKRLKIAKNAIDKSKKFSTEKIITQWWRLINNVANKKK